MARDLTPKDLQKDGPTPERRFICDGPYRPDHRRDFAPPPDTMRPPDLKPWPDQKPWPDVKPWHDLTIPPDLKPPPDTQPTGKWYQAKGHQCATLCTKSKKKSVAGPEGSRCTSGELVALSAWQQGIKYSYGCWPTYCLKRKSFKGFSVGGYCYISGQKQDSNYTDWTMGCYCR